MKPRASFSAWMWLLCAAVGLIATQSVSLVAEMEDSVSKRESQGQSSSAQKRSPQLTLRQAVDRELNSLYSKQGDSKSLQLASSNSRKSMVRTASATSQQNRGQIRQVADQQVAKPKSEIQKQLELLYKKDGRQMPTMDLKELSAQKQAAQAAQKERAAKNAGPSLSPKKPQAKPPSLLEKIFPFTRSKPAPKLSVRRKPGTKTAAQPQQPAKQAPKTAEKAPARKKIPNLLPSFLRRDKQSQAQKALPKAIVPPTPKPQAKKIVKKQAAPQIRTKTPATQIAKQPVLQEKAEPKITQSRPTKKSGDSFGDLFPEMSEDEADGLKSPFNKIVEDKTPKAKIKPKAETPKLESPFNTIPLEDPVVKSETEKPLKAEKPEIKPLQIAQPDTKPADQADPELPKQQEKLDRQNEQKLQRIAERGSISGLKGFCAVTLRDQRELADALPEFTSSFETKTYRFASADAKSKFDKSPEKYAPAASGIDVVLQAQGDELEGSLDHAAWYKDRLYFFTSAETRITFISSPNEFRIED